MDRQGDVVTPVVHQQQQRNFPEPIAVLAMGKVWRKTDVEKWVKEHRPDLSSG
ncbi:DNA-binding protein [Micromonospora sp. NPDC018662]|uniref:DNA-binding protein n=1 Tax=Micromonospora sp. NPDC018662 TaxID=3364238 RepID=UPI0037B94163